MKNLLAGSFALACAAVALAACNSGNSNNPFNPGNCNPPSTTVMIYPIPGATAVPVNTTKIYVASKSSQLNNGNYGTAVQPPNTSGYYQGGNFVRVAASAVPSPAASPGFASPIYYSSSTGNLSGLSTYTIGFNQNVACNPTVLGSFTTGH